MASHILFLYVANRVRSVFSEDFSVLSFDESFWYQVEEDPEYVSKTLNEWEETLLESIPHIT